MVEFSLVFVPLLFLILGSFEFGRAVWTYHSLVSAVKRATRFAIVKGARCGQASSSCLASVADIGQRMRLEGLGLDPNDLDVTLVSKSQSLSCAPLASCMSSSTVWPPSPDNAVGLPLTKVRIPSPCPNEVYERAMGEAMAAALADGIDHVVFGDLFLADIRAYREAQLARIGMTPVFPLWLRDTAALAREMIAAGVEAILTCVDPKQLDPAFAGRRFDGALLDALPAGVDPCGENGEFHTLVTAGPMFRRPIPARVGEAVTRDGFVFADVLPA